MKNIMTKIGLVIASAALVAAIALGALYALRPRQDKTESLYVPVEVQGSGIVDGAGNELESGKAYKMPTSVVYTATTAESQTASEGITLTVKVTPANAADKRVDFTVSWKNASSTWAKNKTVSDYVTVTPQSDGSTTSTLKCLQAFGEQVIVTATSRQDPKIATTCTVDYAKRVTGVSVKIGSDEVFSGNEDFRRIFTLSENSGVGGVVTASYLTNDTYTVNDTFTQTVRLVGSDWNYDTAGGSAPIYWDGRDEGVNAIGKKIYFDKRLFTEFDFAMYTRGSKGASFNTLSDESLKDILEKTNWSNQWYFTMTVSVKGTYNTYEIQRKIGSMGYFVPPVMVSALEFEKQNVVM